MKWILALTMIVFTTGAYCQQTTINATVTDATGQVWFNGSYSITFVPTPGLPNNYHWNGGVFTPQNYKGVLDNTGSFTVTLPDNNTITPAGTQWAFVICPNATAVCTTITTPVTGTNENLSSLFSARVVPPVIFAAPLPRAYNQNEVATPAPTQGGQFYQVIGDIPYYWTGTAWKVLGGANGVVLNPTSPQEICCFPLIIDSALSAQSYNGVINATSFSSLNDAVAACGGTPCTVDVNGPIPLNANLVMQSDQTLRFNQPGIVNLSGFTLTTANIVAPYYQIFDAAVTLGPQVKAPSEEWFPGSDIGARTNALFASCSSAIPCHAYIPSGVYSFTTPIVLPSRTEGMGLTCDKNATLTYTGPGSAIATLGSVNGVNNHGGILLDGGCTLYGTSAGAAGIHTRATQGVTIRDWSVSGFTTGDGIWIDGTNVVRLQNVSSRNNVNGLHLTGNRCNAAGQCQWDRPGDGLTWVSSSIGGNSGYAANAVKVTGSIFTANSGYGIIDTDVIGGSNTQGFNNTYDGNTIEANGSGSILLGFTRSATITHSYFESNGGGIVLGCVGGNPISPPSGYTAQYCGTAAKSTVDANFFNDGSPVSEVMLNFSDSFTGTNNNLNGSAPCLFDSSSYSGEVVLQGNQVYGAGSDTCASGSPGGSLINYWAGGDTTAGAWRFHGNTQFDGAIFASSLITTGTNFPTMDASDRIIAHFGAVVVHQSTVAPAGTCNTGAATMNIWFTPTDMYICDVTWRLVTHS